MSKHPGTFVLPPSTVLWIRMLKIHRRTRKNHCNGVGRVWLPTNIININNIVTVETSSFHDGQKAFENWCEKWIKTGVMNVQSIRNKDLRILDFITENKLDLMLIAETSLRPGGGVWKKSTCLANNGLKINCIDRQIVHKGRGLALVSNGKIKVKLMESTLKKTFEYEL